MMKTTRLLRVASGQRGLAIQVSPRYRYPFPADKHIPSTVVSSNAEGIQGPWGSVIAGRGVDFAVVLLRL